MENDFDKDSLLNDVFEDAASPAFHAELLDKTLREVQRRKRARRRSRNLSAIAAVVAAFALGASLRHWPKGPAPSRPNPLLVHSGPLSPNMIVATQPGTVGVVHSSADFFAVLSTREGERTFELVTDDQLLALSAGRPAALLYRGRAQTELVFLNPSDQAGFPAQ